MDVRGSKHLRGVSASIAWTSGGAALYLPWSRYKLRCRISIDLASLLPKLVQRCLGLSDLVLYHGNVSHQRRISLAASGLFYSSLFSSSSSVPRNFLKMLLLLVKSSSFSGARLPLLIRPCRRLNSFSAQPSFLLALSKALT